jgi:Gas vesicle protein
MAERAVPGSGRSRATSAEAMTAGGMAVPGRAQPVGGGPQSSSLADILERVLDKGIVIAGDIRVNLLDIELLTIKIRLLVASVDKAREIGIDWWEHDPSLSTRGRDLAEENRQLRERLRALEAHRTAQRSVGGDERAKARRPEGADSDD